MNKKITSSVLAALLVAGSTSFSALAAMANGTVVIGTKAFDLAYANNPANAAEITNAVVAANGAIFIKDFEGNWINNVTGLKVLASAIPAVTYKSATGVVTMFDAADKDAVSTTLGATVTGAKTIKVTYTTAVDTTKAVVSLYKGVAPVATASIAWNEAKTEATLTAIIPFTAGEYTVKTSGLATVVADSKLTIAAEVITSIEITSTQLQAKASSPVGYVVKNQYGEVKTMSASDLTVSAVNAKTGVSLTAAVAADGKLTVDASTVTLGDNVVVTITHKATGITRSIVTPAVAVAKIGSFTVSAPTMPTTTTRISVNDTTDTLKIPYVAKDQYGVDAKLTASTNGAIAINAANGLTIISSNNAIIDPANIKTNATSELTFQTGAVSGTVLLTFIQPTTGTSTTLTIVVNGVAALKTFNMVQPSVLATAKTGVTVDYLAVDQYDKTYAKKDFTAAVRPLNLTFISNNTSIVNPLTNIAFNAKNELVITPQAKGAVNVTVYVAGVAQNTITLDVQEEVVPTKIVGLKDVSLSAIENGVVSIKASNLNVVDQYGRALELSGTWSAKLTLKDGSETSLDLGNQLNYTATSAAAIDLNLADTAYANLKGTSTKGTETIIVKLYNGAVAVDTTAYEFNIKTIDVADITSYAFSTVKLLQVTGASATTTVVGKDAAANTVALPAGHVTLLTSDSALFTVNSAAMTVTAAGTTAGTGNISAWIGATKIATTVVTSSTTAPTVAKLEFAKTSYDVTGAVGSTNNTVAADLTKTSQYGVSITETGYWTSSDRTVATVNPTTGEITVVSSGVVTVTYIAINGMTVTTPVIVTVP